MRTSRSLQLYLEQGTVHLYWRCHNKEFYLSSDVFKVIYLRSIRQAMAVRGHKASIGMHSFCLMDNHFHQSITYKKDSISLSKYMQYTNSLFGSSYNKIKQRSGRVIEDRPKTSLIQNENHEMRVHFYIEANPIRARKCKIEQLREYKFSSYRFYAFGIQDEFSSLITVPDWYKNLGRTPFQRQRKYRKLFLKYLEPNWIKEIELKIYSLYCGNESWAKLQLDQLNCRLRLKANNTS